MKISSLLLLVAACCQHHCFIVGWKIQSNKRLIHATSSRLFMSDPDGLIETMRKTLGEKNDVSELAESQSSMLLSFTVIFSFCDFFYNFLPPYSGELMKGLKDLDRDPNMRANNKFIEWLDDNGVWVKSQSTWGRAQHPLVRYSR